MLLEDEELEETPNINDNSILQARNVLEKKLNNRK